MTDNLPVDRSPAKKYADENWMIDIMDVNAIVRKVNETGDVDGVLSYCIDPAQKPYCEVCKALNLPCYGTEEQFAIMTNKKKFKLLCSKCDGVSVVPGYTIDECMAGNVQYSVLVKPAVLHSLRRDYWGR